MRQLSDTDYQRAYRYAVALTADPQHGFDLLHATLAQLLGKSLPADAGLPYLLRALRNRHVDDCRRRQIVLWQSLDDEDSGVAVIATDFGDLEARVIQEDLLRQCWQRLGPAEREVLHLWAVEGYTVDEIAAQTDTPRGTLLARLHRLKRRLADLDPQPSIRPQGVRA
jgi:RNA polymerase sigma-70 factor, ECF subfamily